jgi:hypothetical protein
VEIYSREAQRVIGRFLDRRISLDECLAALDSALAGVSPMPTGPDLDALQALVNRNRRIVTELAEHREKATGKD